MSSRSEFSRDNQPRPSGKLTRRRLLAIGLPTAAAAAFGAVGDHDFRKARELSLKEVLIPVHQLPYAFEGFTVAQLSDFHYHPPFTAKVISDAVYLEEAPGVVAAPFFNISVLCGRDDSVHFDCKE